MTVTRKPVGGVETPVAPPSIPASLPPYPTSRSTDQDYASNAPPYHSQTATPTAQHDNSLGISEDLAGLRFDVKVAEDEVAPEDDTSDWDASDDDERAESNRSARRQEKGKAKESIPEQPTTAPLGDNDQIDAPIPESLQIRPPSAQNRTQTNPFLRKKSQESQETAVPSQSGTYYDNQAGGLPERERSASYNPFAQPQASRPEPASPSSIYPTYPNTSPTSADRGDNGYPHTAGATPPAHPPPPPPASHVLVSPKSGSAAPAVTVEPPSAALNADSSLIDISNSSEMQSAPSKEEALPTENVQEKMAEQRNETYPLKHIRWFDSAIGKSRVSPILIQNANGPCPLLALVNALSLSVPSDTQFGLIEALQSREQISLGFLLDAVFDELVSSRRGSTARKLPDVNELYSFLITLHTGMNVNPRFVNPSHDQQPSSTSPLGTFEDTREMQLYSTFTIPLIHGWLPSEEDPAAAAFARSAPSYEEAQNILFREEELEHKLESTGLSRQEQVLFKDITTVKQFLNKWPTQLTDHGLQAMQTSMAPGQFSILFRNDHFSTIYHEPQSQRLMTLVTDAGYASHDEIVWESLVDVSGGQTEFFSGDYRSVSHNNNNSDYTGASSSADGNKWTTVPPRGKRGKQASNLEPASSTTNSTFSAPSTSSAKESHQRSHSEQEDHDLALAMQLQEEEEERTRSERAAQRRRENELSEQFISRETSRQSQTQPQTQPQTQSQTSQRPPAVPPRRTPNTNVSARPPVNRPADENNDDAPPSYEQAAAQKPFRPPRGHPANEHAPIRSPQPSTSQPQYAPPSSTPPGAGRVRRGPNPASASTPWDPTGIRRGDYTSSQSIEDRNEGCAIM